MGERGDAPAQCLVPVASGRVGARACGRARRLSTHLLPPPMRPCVRLQPLSRGRALRVPSRSVHHHNHHRRRRLQCARRRQHAQLARRACSSLHLVASRARSCRGWSVGRSLGGRRSQQQPVVRNPINTQTRMHSLLCCCCCLQLATRLLAHATRDLRAMAS